MLKRIKHIKKVGEFKNTGHCAFGEVVLVYGLNGYGKSTFSDICRSLGQDKPEIIINRRTIDSDSQVTPKQEISFSYIDDSDSSEKDLKFTNNQWEKDNFNFDVEVFDSRFIEENVFTGLSISRPNRENLTNLILGKENVELAKEIASLKQEQNKLNQKYTTLVDSLKKRLDILNLGVTLEELESIEKDSDVDKIKIESYRLEKEKEKIQNTLNKTDTIQGLDNPQKVNLSTNFIELVTGGLGILKRDFKDIDPNALGKLKSHINENFKQKDGYEDEWIKKGVIFYTNFHSTISDTKCPFCGQSLKKAEELIKAYHAFFGELYQDYCNSLEKEITDKTIQLKNVIQDLDKIVDDLKNNLICFNKYQDYFSSKDKKNVETIGHKTKEIEYFIGDVKRSSNEIINTLKKQFEEKLKTPFELIEVKEINLDSSISKFKQLDTYINAYNQEVDKLINSIKELKEEPYKQELRNKSLEVTASLNGYEKQLKRHEFDPELKILMKLKEEKKKLKGDIKQKQSGLEEKNSQFMEDYFNRVSDLFNSLGAVNFKIEKNFSRRGNQPVYGFIIKFKDQDITNDLVPYIFSDSDRRALALSIFLAKLEAKSKLGNGISNTILILDDPVISFDDNRISATIMKIKELIRECRQVIILSHYREFLKKIYDNIKDLPQEARYLMIKRNQTGSQFCEIRNMQIELDEYSNTIDEMERFIDGENINASKIRKELRIVLQKELEWRYRRQLKGSNYDGLGGLVNYLKQTNVISDDLAQKIYGFNDLVKKDSHDINVNSPEDTRNLTMQILNFIFKGLNP